MKRRGRETEKYEKEREEKKYKNENILEETLKSGKIETANIPKISYFGTRQSAAVYCVTLLKKIKNKKNKKLQVEITTMVIPQLILLCFGFPSMRNCWLSDVSIYFLHQ